MTDRNAYIVVGLVLAAILGVFMAGAGVFTTKWGAWPAEYCTFWIDKQLIGTYDPNHAVYDVPAVIEKGGRENLEGQCLAMAKAAVERCSEYQFAGDRAINCVNTYFIGPLYSDLWEPWKKKNEVLTKSYIEQEAQREKEADVEVQRLLSQGVGQ